MLRLSKPRELEAVDRASILVKATWDKEALVWVAESDDVAGLTTEAATLEDLSEKVLQMIPELLELNGHPADYLDIPVHIMAERVARITNPCY